MSTFGVSPDFGGNDLWTTISGTAAGPSIDQVDSDNLVTKTKETEFRFKQVNSMPGARLTNPLSEFSSYTYQLSLYMITPDAYNLFVASGRKNINIANNSNNKAGAYLIAQSGGINDTSKRAPGFEYDFYIDNLKQVGVVSPNSTLAPTFEYTHEFQIIEPYGFSFLANLKQTAKTVVDYIKSTGTTNTDVSIDALKQMFVLGIKFLGYDKNGKVVNTENILEKFEAITITDLKFKIDGKTVIYNIKAVPTSVIETFYVKKGRIDTGAYNLTGRTVGDALDGLKKVLNDSEVIYKEKRNYNFVFVGENADKIKNALIVNKEDVDKAKWPMPKVSNASQLNPSLAEKAQPTNTQRIIKIDRDTPIIQAINKIVTQSQYTIDSLTKIFSSEIEPDSVDGYKEISLTSDKAQWINVSSIVNNPRYDTSRNDWAYDVTFIIQTYKTPFIVSPAYISKVDKYYGPVKTYRYWYTGENSEIIKYEQAFNTLYFTNTLKTIDGISQSPVPVAGNKRTGQEKLGSTGVGLEAQNTYVNSLYDPGAWATAKIEILGDPDFIMYAGPSEESIQGNPFYEKDGFTVNPRSAQMFIEIDFREGIDYDNRSGLMNINENLILYQYPPPIANKVKGVSYKVNKIVSNFKNGRFTQELDLVINDFSEEAAIYNQQQLKEETKQNNRRDIRKIDNIQGFFTETPPEQNVRYSTTNTTYDPVTNTVLGPILPDD